MRSIRHELNFSPLTRRLYGENRRAIFLQLITVSSLSLLEVFSLGLIIPMVQSLQGESALVLFGLEWSPGIGQLPWYFLLMLLAVGLRLGLSYLLHRDEARLQLKILMQLRQAVLKSIQKLTFYSLSRTHTGELAKRYMDQPEAVTIHLASTLRFVHALVLLLAYISLLFFISWPLTLSAIAVSAVAFVCTRWCQNKISFWATRRLQTEHELQQKITDDLKGWLSIKLAGFQDGRRVLHDRLNQDLISHSQTLIHWRDLSQIMGSGLVTVIVIGSAFGISLVRPELFIEHLALGAAFLVTLMRLQARLSVITQSLSALAETRCELDDLSRFIAQHIEAVPRSERHLAPSPKKEMLHTEQSKIALPFTLECRDLNFSYGNASVLQNLNWTTHSQQIIGLQGESGSGKTTLSLLLANFLKPNSGQILWLDQNLKPIQLKVALVSESPHIFHESLLWNLTGGASSNSSEINNVLRMTCLDEWVASLEQGLHTPLSSLVNKISAGQRQRLAVARALLSYPDVLILDEATNGLDLETEKHLLTNTIKFMKRGLLIIISHRPQTLSFTYRQLTLTGGALVAEKLASPSANHDRLLIQD